ncbi:fimbrial protein [Pseudomonas sp. LJDD11]|uniref:fimbrial protein n=1 Tax=unclassified Pseudomonas TaxID=196821 RepID=UPI0020977D9B|nr:MULTISPECIES: fimbrial protein [unclassified Pseudomonas]MCO8162957.1 fimbrial protein [Pseudomonas sp. 21LCFQ010]MCQ9424519.1 fimbrial protein [Pseudomonas sp. LJDD11]
MKKIWFALCLASATVNAADVVTLNVKGTLVRPPCQLSTGTTLTADFGNVRIDEVPQTATKSLPVTMNCPAGSGLNVSFSSSNGTYTSTVAKTTANNLGVSLLWADNSAANLQGSAKTYSNLNGNVDISLKAQLVKRGDLAPGQFNSSIVMTINYQ